MTPFILMIALSMHAIFEGMAVGILENKSDVINLVVAIVLHKGAEAAALVTHSCSKQCLRLGSKFQQKHER